ncbi:MAG: hypothetical protein ABIH92_00995 [Nanoarchaeota archaeon]
MMLVVNHVDQIPITAEAPARKKTKGVYGPRVRLKKDHTVGANIVLQIPFRT